MKPRPLTDNVYAVGAVDWDRRLFDALIPLPDGTSYNSYYIRGSEKTALLDAVDPAKAGVLMAYLDELPPVDLIIAHHAEQDHSGALPGLLASYPAGPAGLLAQGQGHAHRPPRPARRPDHDGRGRRDAVAWATRPCEFIHTPWVHWPETMCTYLREDKILFSCDFFGSHLAQSDLFVDDEERTYEAAKRYFAEIMMPFRTAIQKNLDRLRDYPIDMIAPSHGPVYRRPQTILQAYRDWVKDTPKNGVVIAYVSMHGSTETMVERLVDGLDARGVDGLPVQHGRRRHRQAGLAPGRRRDDRPGRPGRPRRPPSPAGPCRHPGQRPPAQSPPGGVHRHLRLGPQDGRAAARLHPQPEGRDSAPGPVQGRAPGGRRPAVDALAETIAARHKAWGLA